VSILEYLLQSSFVGRYAFWDFLLNRRLSISTLLVLAIIAGPTLSAAASMWSCQCLQSNSGVGCCDADEPCAADRCCSDEDESCCGDDKPLDQSCEQDCIQDCKQACDQDDRQVCAALIGVDCPSCSCGEQQSPGSSGSSPLRDRQSTEPCGVMLPAIVIGQPMVWPAPTIAVSRPPPVDLDRLLPGRALDLLSVLCVWTT
jgi:hypothetical protein